MEVNETNSSKKVQFINPAINYIEKALKPFNRILRLFIFLIMCISINHVLNYPIFSLQITVFISLLFIQTVIFFLKIRTNYGKLIEKKDRAQREVFLCHSLQKNIYYNESLIWISMVLLFYFRFTNNESIFYIEKFKEFDSTFLFKTTFATILGYVLSTTYLYIKSLLIKQENKKIKSNLDANQVVDIFTDNINYAYRRIFVFVIVMMSSFILSLNLIIKGGNETINNYFDLAIIVFIINLGYTIFHILKVRKIIDITEFKIKGGAEVFGSLQLIQHITSLMVLFSFMLIYLIDSTKFPFDILWPILAPFLITNLLSPKNEYFKLVK